MGPMPLAEDMVSRLQSETATDPTSTEEGQDKGLN